MRCPFCRSVQTRWIESDLTCFECVRTVECRRDPPTSYEEFDEAPSAGSFARWCTAADDALDADHDWLLTEIARLDRYRTHVIGKAGKATRSRMTLMILGECARAIWNIARTRSGEADLIVQASRARTTAYAGYRHAAAAALCPKPILGLGTGMPSGGTQPTHGTPGGMQFKLMAVAPSHVSSGAARSEDVLIDRIDLDAALKASGVSETDRQLLELVDVGVQRSRARRSRRGIALAVEPLSVADALERLDGAPGLPRTTREGKIRVQRARDALRGALRSAGLIPPAERAPVRAAAKVEPRTPRRASEAFA
jgi:hypothetical protein